MCNSKDVKIHRCIECENKLKEVVKKLKRVYDTVYSDIGE